MYNFKINKNGTYRDFLGYTIICMIKDLKKLEYIEEFLKKSPLIKYYSPLPYQSYHMTVFNIWTHHSNFLQKHLNFFQKYYNEIEIRKIKETFNLINYWYDPLDYLNIQMINMAEICEKYDWTDLKGQINTIQLKNTIQLLISIEPNVENKIISFRNECFKLSSHADKGLVAHVTLAYKYKDIPEIENEILNCELQKLEKILKNIDLEFDGPEPYRFSSMTNYVKASSWWT